MAISVNALITASSTSNAASYNTASITPTSGRVLVAVFTFTGIGSDVTGTISGLSATWNSIGRIWDSGAARELTAFYATNYTGSGALTLGNSDSATTCVWSVYEIDGADTSSPIVASSFKTLVSTTTTTPTITLNAAAGSSNRPFSAFACANNTANQIAPRTNWTEIHDDVESTPSSNLETQWRSDAFETTASATGPSAIYLGVAWETAIAATGGNAPAETVAVTSASQNAGGKVDNSTQSSSPSAVSQNPSAKIDISGGSAGLTAAALDATIQTGAGEDPTAEPSAAVAAASALDAKANVLAYHR